MKNQESLSITILDKEYRIACPAGEQDSLRASAQELNRKLNEIKNKGSVIGTERIAIITALNLCHELLNGRAMQAEHTELNDRIDSLSEKIDISIREIKLS